MFNDIIAGYRAQRNFAVNRIMIRNMFPESYRRWLEIIYTISYGIGALLNIAMIVFCARLGIRKIRNRKN